MKKSILLAVIALLAISAPSLHAQGHNNYGPVSHHGDRDRDRQQDDEYRMSHLDGFAGELIGLVLPDRILNAPIKSGRWEAAESDKVRIADYYTNSANIRLLRSGTTVVNYKYRVVRDGKEVSESYPFTIRIHRIEPEAISVPSTLYLGWDVRQNLYEHVKLLPEYAEGTMTFELDDPTIADIDGSYTGAHIVGRQLGETTLHIETADGLHADTRVVVEVPALRSVDIEAEEKTLRIGDEQQLMLELSPARAQATFTWSSEKPGIVTVDQDGTIRALAEGKATIRVISDNGKKDSITIKVKK